MEDVLKEKLWLYIINNNPDLMFTLQEEYRVSEYLNEKIVTVKSIVDELLEEATPQYIIEEICLNLLTEDLKPSRYVYIRLLLEEEFQSNYNQFYESGILIYEVINLVESCKEVFETIGFTNENEDNTFLKHAIIGQMAVYLN
ncbi:hypothetical protein [Flavobacterium turcicum]|uniref:DUF1896 family protein n=1 Tax=Flavobacterium turcicum TaxID=2764718 RepID=A0ABR7JED2_9FLAO|nr:hypothetical protein [Flavobacterium turcicum]MBC5862865.1 hypothetical protein [Flavobacterium turcicum]NHL01597.1 hypothetical protein [Flavobacterium turcicum]